MRGRIECNIDITLSYIYNFKAQGMDTTGETMG